MISGTSQAILIKKWFGIETLDINILLIKKKKLKPTTHNTEKALFRSGMERHEINA